jgi:ribosomal protein S18 acetylase RimI-like enzyme
VEIRDARPDEFDELGDVRLVAYRADGYLSPQSTYATTLRALGADGRSVILVAVGEKGTPAAGAASNSVASDTVQAQSGRGGILGTVMLQPGPAPGETIAGLGEAEIRALAVIPEARGAGVGEALLSAVMGRAAATGVEHLVLLTQPGMKAAQRLYARAGFVRLPERDWSPEPGLTLLAYGLVVGG